MKVPILAVCYVDCDIDDDLGAPDEQSLEAWFDYLQAMSPEDYQRLSQSLKADSGLVDSSIELIGMLETAVDNGTIDDFDFSRAAIIDTLSGSNG